MMESYQKNLLVLDGSSHHLMGLILYKRIIKIYWKLTLNASGRTHIRIYKESRTLIVLLQKSFWMLLLATEKCRDEMPTPMASKPVCIASSSFLKLFFIDGNSSFQNNLIFIEQFLKHICIILRNYQVEKNQDVLQKVLI
jgi:hypothetical protein